ALALALAAAIRARDLSALPRPCMDRRPPPARKRCHRRNERGAARRLRGAMDTLGLGRVDEQTGRRRPRRLLGWFVFVGVLTFIGWAGRLSSGPPDPNGAYEWDLGVGATIQFV